MAFALSFLYVLLIYITPWYLIPGLAPYRVQIWVVAAAVGATAVTLAARREWIRSPQLYLVILFMGAIAVSRAMQGWLRGALIAWGDFLPAIVILPLLAFNGRSLRKLRALQVALISLAIYIVIIGSIEFAAGHGTSTFKLEYTVRNDRTGAIVSEIRRLRFVGGLGDPNDLAQFLLVILPFVWIWWGGGLLAKLAVIPVSGIIAYGIYLTRSRGALLGFAVILALSVRRRLRILGSAIVAVGTAAGLLMLGFTGGRDISIQGGEDRLRLWSEGLALLKHSPLWGVGYGYFTEYSDMTAHNSFLLVAAELGLPGLVLWLSMFLVSILQMRRLMDTRHSPTSSPDVIRHATAIQLALYGYLVTACFLSRAYQPMPYLPLGMATALAEMELSRRKTTLLPAAGVWLGLAIGIACGVLLLIYVAVRLRAI